MPLPGAELVSSARAWAETLLGDCVAMGRRVWLVNLGVEPYERAEALQHELVDWRQRELIDDVLLLLEHTPVITLGRRADESHVLASEEVLRREGVDLRRCERGGDVTYHGPGQLVGYPVLHLPSHGLGASDYMHRLEDVSAELLGAYGIETHRRDGVIGVWVGENKITALGVRIKRRVAFHGFALNVAPNMAHWSLIVPCGITDGGVTSMATELTSRALPVPSMSQVRERAAHHFARVFDVTLETTTLADLRERARAAELAAHLQSCVTA